MPGTVWPRGKFNACTIFSLAVLITTNSGCSNIHCCFSYESKNEASSKFFIIGIGVVTHPATHGNNDIMIANSKSLGLSFSSHSGIQMGMGYMDTSIVSVPTNAESITEIKTCPIDDKTIKVQVYK